MISSQNDLVIVVLLIVNFVLCVFNYKKISEQLSCMFVWVKCQQNRNKF